MKNMKSAETFKNTITNDDFWSARQARRDNCGILHRKVYHANVSQPLGKYTFGYPEEKTIILVEMYTWAAYGITFRISLKFVDVEGATGTNVQLLFFLAPRSFSCE